MDKADLHRTTGYQEYGPSVNSLKYEALLHEVLQKVGEPILWIDSFGRIEMASIEAVKAFGSPLIGIRFWDRFKDEEFGFSLRESLRYGISHKVLHQNVMGKDVEVRVSVLEAGVLVLLRDVSCNRRLIELQTRNERMKVLGEMSSTVAHELKNPLAGIRGYAALLQRDLAKDPHLQDMAGQVVQGTKVLEELVSTILEYARPLRLKLETTDLGVFVRQVVRLFRADPAFPSNIRVTLHIPPAALLVPMDAMAMQRALLNLLINAKEAMPNGGTITVTLFCEGNRYQIGIGDSGIGMNEEELSSLFTPHFTTKGQGNGLGLVETKKIVEGHQAAIEVRSTPGLGTVFTITFRKEV